VEGASRQSLRQLRASLDALVAPPSPAPGADDDRVLGSAVTTEPGIGADALGELAEQLFAVSSLVERELGLRRALTDPGMPAAGRRRLLERIVTGRVSGPAADLLGAAVELRWSRPLDLPQSLEELGVEALLATAQLDGSLDEVEDELFRFGRILDRDARLTLALTDTAVPFERKAELLERLLADRARPVTVRLAERAVADQFRRDLQRTIEHYTNLAAERRRRVVGVARVARPLDADQTARLRAAVSRFFGHDVQLQVDVDPSVLGGVVVRVGDEVVDGSVLRRLAEARRHLLR
jgi:F-type H+-transporting ATPase subunit delta